MQNDVYVQHIDGALPVLCFVQRAARTGFTTLAHIHDHIEIIYCTQGRYVFRLGDSEYTVGAGELVTIRSRELHEIRCIDAPGSYFVLQVSPDLLPSTPKSLTEFRYMIPFTVRDGYLEKVVRADGDADMIEGLLSRTANECALKNYGWELAVRSSVCGILLWILRRNRERDGGGDVFPGEAALKIKEAADRATEDMSQEFTMQDAADACGFSYTYFSRVFRSVTGVSFSDYIADRRTDNARRLLAATDMSVTDIAMECGYGSASYFIKCFRSRTGLSPKKYREQQRSAYERDFLQDNKQ